MSDLPHHLPSIVLVDDDADQLFLTRKMLEKAGVKNPLVEIGGGPEAIAYLDGCGGHDGSAETALPALVFLDLRMPTADGFDVLRWVRSKPALSSVKVIILTSSDDQDDVKRCTALGAQGFLMKHPNSAVLAAVLRQTLGENVGLISAPAILSA